MGGTAGLNIATKSPNQTHFQHLIKRPFIKAGGGRSGPDFKIL